ncbi:MAG: pentapeptide repeat-containing protein [Chromatiales bacterium]|nr:pentapeptide repeat-containing protein [Chromatiales bacterium]
MSSQELWYCRVQEESYGPLTLVQMLHYIILNRVGDDDEVSNDEENWQPLKQVNMLNPKSVMGLKGILSDEDKSYLEATLAWREKNITESSEEDPIVDEYIALRRRRAKRKNPVVGYVILFLLIVVVGGGAFLIPKNEIQIAIDCKSPAAPNVNWTNCSFEGAILDNKDLQGAKLRNIKLRGAQLLATNLSKADIAYGDLSLTKLRAVRFDGADLRGANLRKSDLRRASFVGADLSAADLRGANLTGANLEGVKLGKALWTDGGTCQVGSVGRCIQ